ncbi:death domain-containing protein 1 [Engraulis encrasicolus]|uniref:death domain-containing protein 1 n=1 Tax=Engraulis encrasicolus TaxID=184585 RepID=UPI002FCEB481
MKGLSGKSKASGSEDAPPLCYVTAPRAVSKVVTCDLVNGLSSLMVSDLEELVSNVLELQLPTKTCFPITVAIPFRSRYRGNYRDILVKVVDQDSRVSYVTPVSTEGSYGGKKGSYAEVRVYTLGVFAVLSCLRKETYTIPRRGLSLKLSIDSRICLDYMPGAFTSPVIAQAVVQPVDPALLSTLKSNVEVYHTVLSTSPLLYLTHPSTQAPRRPLALTLPCPPNPERQSQRPGEEGDTTTTTTTAVAVSASVKSSRELAKEQLVVLGWREEQWNVLDHVPVKNLQNGLVSFELAEHFERLLVFRLQFPVRSSYLVAVVEEIEASVRRAMVTIVLRRQRQDPHSVVVAALPSRDLDWELAKLQGQAYCGPPEPSGEISMAEGDQLLLSFSGNITGMAKGDTRPVDRESVFLKTITFHNQRKNHEYLTLAVLDPFGNYSSPHYKGLAVFQCIPRGQLVWKGNAVAPAPQHPLGEPVCKLSLTLPKKLRIASRLSSARLLPHTHSDSLSDELLSWLCDELCEEEAALLVLALRVKRSAVQLARLRAGPEPEAVQLARLRAGPEPEGTTINRDSHSTSSPNSPNNLSLPGASPGPGPRQAFHALALWRRSLPSHGPKAPLLARCLTRAGRPDLARELLLRERGR